MRGNSSPRRTEGSQNGLPGKMIMTILAGVKEVRLCLQAATGTVISNESTAHPPRLAKDGSDDRHKTQQLRRSVLALLLAHLAYELAHRSFRQNAC